MNDLISRSEAITAIQKAYADTEGGTDKLAVWKNVGLTNALHIMQDLPSAQPHDIARDIATIIENEKNMRVILKNAQPDAPDTNGGDIIYRQAAIDALESIGSLDTEADRQYARTVFENLPPAQTEIIRCKDCRHNGSFDTDCPIKWNGKDFCSFAERRTDE